MSGKNTKKTLPKSAAPAAVAPSLTEAGLDKRLLWFLVLVSFFLFANTLGHGFVLDDIAVIEQNTIVQQGFAGIPKILTTFYWEGYWHSNAGLYRPLSLILFAIEWGLSPNNPGLHHFVNVLLYAISIGVLYRLLRLLFANYTAWIPFCITLLFAVHPIHTEVVANIKSRDEILCFLFFVLTFRYVVKNGLATTKNKAIACGLFLLCLLSKEAGLLFLPIIGVYFLLFRKTSVLQTARTFLPLILISIIWLTWHQYIIRTSPFERISYTYLDNSVVGCDSPAAQVATGIAILGRYLLKTVAPVNMSYDYSYNEIPCESFASPIVWGTLLIVFGLGYAIYRCWKTQPAIAFGLIYFFISIALVTNIFTLIGATMGDRLLYAPVLGICIAAVFGVYALLKQTSVATYQHSAFYGFALLAVIASITSFQRNRVWESNATLFLADVAHAPNSSRTHFNEGTMLMSQLPENIDRQGSLLPAVVACFEQALKIDPKDIGSHINLGVCYYRLGDYKRSIRHTATALRLNPADSTIVPNLADAYFKDNQFESAIVYYQRVIPTKSATAANFNFMGVARFNQQRYPEAIVIFQQGLQRFPENEELLMNLGSAYGASQQALKAKETFEAILAINPKNKQAMRFLAMAYQSLGDIRNAQKYSNLFNTP